MNRICIFLYLSAFSFRPFGALLLALRLRLLP